MNGNRTEVRSQNPTSKSDSINWPRWGCKHHIRRNGPTSKANFAPHSFKLKHGKCKIFGTWLKCVVIDVLKRVYSGHIIPLMELPDGSISSHVGSTTSYFSYNSPQRWCIILPLCWKEQLYSWLDGQSIEHGLTWWTARLAIKLSSRWA